MAEVATDVSINAPDYELGIEALPPSVVSAGLATAAPVCASMCFQMAMVQGNAELAAYTVVDLAAGDCYCLAARPVADNVPEAPTDADATHLLHLYGAQTTDAHVYLVHHHPASTAVSLSTRPALLEWVDASPSGYQRNFVATDTFANPATSTTESCAWRAPSKRAMRSWAVT